MPKKSTRGHYTPEQKAQIVLELPREEQTIGQIAAAHNIHVTMLRKWKAQAMERLPSIFNNENQAGRDLELAHEREREELYAEIGQLTTQSAWLSVRPKTT